MAKAKTKKTKTTTAYELAVKAWRKSGHKQDSAIKDLIAAIKSRPSLLDHVVEQHATSLITIVRGRTRQATLEPQDESEVKTYILTPSVIRSPLGASSVRTGMLIERDILDYPLQFLNKSLGDATPNEVENVTLARCEGEAKKTMKICAGLRAIISGLPNKNVPIRKQITSAAAQKIAKQHSIYKDLIV
jgi:hypothetical protein